MPAQCDHLNIPLQTVNFAQTYWDQVFQHFLDEYAAGRTPNPDILCNKEIKFKAFLDYALKQGADYIATGHYARCEFHQNCFELLKGNDPSKDQSYFLYTLQQQQLAHSLFPLGHLLKTQVREIAKEAGFINFDKKDSTGICFIGERKFKTFLQEYLLAQPGQIETVDGQVIGRHDGLMYYTLGQRQGLGIGGQKQAKEAPWYVINKDIARNVLVVAQQHDHPLLLSAELTCKQVHWVKGTAPSSFSCAAKTRYRQTEQPCQVKKITDDLWQVNFMQPQWAITPGQSVVFYQENVCLGGGIIN
jgi:tRNA-uridine 2-sulfurtransferase